MGVEENYHCNSQILFFKLVTNTIYFSKYEHILQQILFVKKQTSQENLCFEVQNWKQ